MQINKCDICKKKLRFNEYVNIRVGFDRCEICNSCSKPVFNFLKKNKLVKKNEEENQKYHK